MYRRRRPRLTNLTEKEQEQELRTELTEEQQQRANKNWDKAKTKRLILGTFNNREFNPRGFRTNSRGDLVGDQKIERILRNFGDIGHYQKRNYPEIDYDGWTGMKPIYEMDKNIDGIDYRKIFKLKTRDSDLIFKKMNDVTPKTLPDHIKYIDDIGNESNFEDSWGIRINLKNGLRLRSDLMEAAASDSHEKPLIFVMSTNAHVALKVSYRGKIFSIGYGKPAPDHTHYGLKPNYVAKRIENYLDRKAPKLMEQDDFHGLQGVLWSTDFIPPGDIHAVKTIWVDYLNHGMANRLNNYLKRVKHVEILYKEIIINGELETRISNQTELYLKDSVYATLAGHIHPEYGNAGKAKNCIVWAGEILGRNFNCGLTYAPDNCKSIPDDMIEALYTGQPKVSFGDDPTHYFYSFNDTFLKKAQDSVKPGIITQIGRNPRTACAMCGATIGCVNGVCDDVETAAAKAAAGAAVGAFAGKCCDETVNALLGTGTCEAGAVCEAPEEQVMRRRGGKTHKRKKKKQNRRKTKKRNRKKTNKHKKRQINIKRLNHKRKFKKKTRKTII